MASNTELYVGNLPPNTTDDQVRDLFSEFGKIVECDVIRKYAFIHFSESKHALVAISQMNNTEWKGNILKVKQCNSTTKLYVSNLPKNTTGISVRKLFSTVGKVVACVIINDYGFVHFAGSSDALKAVEKLNGKEWNGTTLKVQTSHSKVHVKRGMGVQGGPGVQGERIRPGKTGHLRRDFKGGNIHKKTTTTLDNISKEISAMNGSIGDVYSFISNYGSNISRYRDTNSYKDSPLDDFHQTTYPKDWQRNNYNGDQSSRYLHSNTDDYNSDKYSTMNRRDPYYNDYPEPTEAPSRYRHRPYPTADERRLLSSSVSDSNARLSLSSLYSLSSYHPGRNNSNDRDMNTGKTTSRYLHSNSDDYNSDKYSTMNRRDPYYDDYPEPTEAPSRYRHPPYPTADERRLLSSSVSDSNARLSSLSSLYSLSSYHPGRNNSNDRDMNTGKTTSRYLHSNSDDYNTDKYSTMNRRDPYYDDYPEPTETPSRYRHPPYPTADERRLLSSSVSVTNVRPSSPSYSLSSPSYSLSSSRPSRNNSNSRDANPYFRPPPEYYEDRRRTDRW